MCNYCFDDGVVFLLMSFYQWYNIFQVLLLSHFIRENLCWYLYAWQTDEATYDGHESRHKVDSVQSRQGDQKTSKLRQIRKTKG